MDTGGVAGLDDTLLLGGWPATSNSYVEREACVGILENVSPLALSLALRDLTSDIGHNRAISRKITRVFR